MEQLCAKDIFKSLHDLTNPGDKRLQQLASVAQQVTELGIRGYTCPQAECNYVAGFMQGGTLPNRGECKLETERSD